MKCTTTREINKPIDRAWTEQGSEALFPPLPFKAGAAVDCTLTYSSAATKATGSSSVGSTSLSKLLKNSHDRSVVSTVGVTVPGYSAIVVLGRKI